MQDQPLTKVEPQQDGRAMAILAHCSILFGLPIFAAPLILRTQPLALHHAKAAGVNYLLFVVFVIVALVSWEWLILLTLLNYIPAIFGICHAAVGARPSRFAFGLAGERIFHRIKPIDTPKRLTHEPTRKS